MQLDIHGDKLKITEAIKSYTISKLSKLDKYFEESEKVKGRALIKVKGHEQIVEVTIPIKGLTLRTEVSHGDLYAAIDLAIDKLERQIRKNRTRINSKGMKFNLNNFNEEYQDEKEDEGQVVKRKKLDMKPMDEEEAILQMNLLGHDFFVFKDSHSSKICVIYKRKDGNFGLIET